MQKGGIAFFDFDGTITSRDSFLAFLKYDVGSMRFYVGILLLSPVLICYLLNFIPNTKAKEMAIKHFWKGRSEAVLRQKGASFAEMVIPNILKPEAMKALNNHIKQGDVVVVVSSSFDIYIKPWCEIKNIMLIATEAQAENGLLTGNLKTPNCYGIEKVNRIKSLIKLKNYATIYAYGNSSGDKEMLSIADKSYYRVFNMGHM